ncbi:N-acyl-D-amino-acid deacylase family protein [Paenibacillus koleovorans]|uniref:N-acyl-D-amino-acid deacylase family protein n=1 Tax=Paenibacillus koleovorans TaxID=121608 RepID=UPI0013E30DAE|nr:amidohydrolase family protein [Paenibacillus koleovorans]
MKFDLVIQGGLLIDGTGASAKRADLGIIGDRIEAIGDLTGADAERILDASGKVVAPGFIDVHVHSELAILGGIDQYAPLKMGVTTQLASPDGFSWAPLSQHRLLQQKAYLHAFYEDALIETNGDMSMDKLFSIFHGRLPSNLALQVPHGSIRLEAVGWEDREATEDELKRMERMVRDWMEAGAVAFCTGLEYEPMRRANLRELVRLSKVAAEYGGIYVAHQRGYAERVVAGCAETFAIAEQADIPVHISHFAVDELAGEQINFACSQGIDVTFDMYPYPAGCTHLLLAFPAELQLGSLEEVKERIKQKSIRQQYAEQLNKAFPVDRLRFASLGTQESTGWEGKTLGQVQQEMGLDLPDAICEILLSTDFQALMIYHWPQERYPILKPTFQHPLHMISTDGIYVGQKPHPRGFGTYPKVLGEFVREHKWISLEQAIYKMSGFPARQFKIKNRGTLIENHYADIVIFDPETINGNASFEHPRQDPSGIEYVLVNGKVIIHNNEISSGLYGRIL